MSNVDQQDEIQIYSGVPKRSISSERSAWKKFLNFFIPWLSHKHELSERFLEAKVLHEEAAAFKTFAEGLTSLETARKIAADASIIEQEKLRQRGNQPFTEQEARAQADILIQKMQYLSAVYGFNITGEIRAPKKGIEEEGI